jgi:hypothetical protein
MKIWIFLLVPVFILLTVSCNMEKRLYRNGWYIEKNKPHTLTANPGSNPVSGASAYEQYEKPVSIPVSAAADSSVVTNTTVNPVIEPQVPDTSLPKKDVKTMSHRELIKSMKEKGCQKPHESANLMYWLAIASICLFWFLPLSLILALVVVAVSESAEEKVIASGECPRENLELIRRGRRMARGFLFVALFVGIALVALLFAMIIVLVARL